MPARGAADKWMLEGVREHEQFQRAFQSAKEHALNAGIFFQSAQANFEHGEWDNFIAGYSHKISRATIYRYLQFAQEVLEWAKSENPKLVGMEKLSAAAREMVLQSPKGLVALCRELKLMRKFGEYDEVKYRARKLLGDGGAQIEFEFEAAEKTLQMLCDPKVHFKFPEGTDEAVALTELQGTLKSASLRVSSRLRELNAIKV